MPYEKENDGKFAFSRPGNIVIGAVVGAATSFVTTGISKGASWYAGQVYKSYAAAF